MEPPKLEDIDTAVRHLKLLGALLPTLNGQVTQDDGDLTVLGEIIARLPVDVLLGKLIVMGHLFGNLDDCCIIAAGLNGKSIFSTFYDKRLMSYSSKLYWADGTYSDCVAILLAFKAWDELAEKGGFQHRSKQHLNKEK